MPFCLPIGKKYPCEHSILAKSWVNCYKEEEFMWVGGKYSLGHSSPDNIPPDKIPLE